MSETVISSSRSKIRITDGAYFAPDTVIVRSGFTANTVELCVTKGGDETDASGTVLTIDEAKQVIEALTLALEQYDDSEQPSLL